MRPPTTPCADICPVTTGMDCLLVVLRHIYSLAMTGKDGLANQDWFKDAESRNPILRFAWRVFGDLGLKDEDASKDKAKFLDELPFSKDSFLTIFSSDLMKTTFWSQAPFHLFQTPPDPGMLHLDLGALPDSAAQEIMDGMGSMDFPDVVDTPITPHIIRLRYTPGVKRVTFQVFRQIYFTQRVRSDDDKKHSLHKHEVVYSLVAVVRLRSHPDEEDSVRTYAPSGKGILPDCEPLEYTPGDWSIETSDHSFALFFLRTDDGPLDSEWPELSAPSRRLDPGLEQLFVIRDIRSDAARSPRAELPDKRTMFPVSSVPPAGL